MSSALQGQLASRESTKSGRNILECDEKRGAHLELSHKPRNKTHLPVSG